MTNGQEMLPYFNEVPFQLLVVFIFVATVGAGINFVSFFHFKSRPGLGNRFQALLNAVDMIVCVYYALIAIAGFTTGDETINDPIIKDLDNFGETFYLLMIIISGLVTVYLSIIRAILTVDPFFKIEKRIVIVSFVGVATLLFAMLVLQMIHLQPIMNQVIESQDDLKKFLLWKTLTEVVPTSLLILLMLASSLVTWKSLSSAISDNRGPRSKKLKKC